jgi:hypothetical protein
MTQSSPQSQATEVWRRFAGMFGADSLERKFGDTIPDEWVAMISKLNGYQVQRGIRQLAYSGKAHVPSLPEFVKLCRDAEHDPKPTPVHPALTHDAEPNIWVVAGNKRLLGHITRRIPESLHCYGHRSHLSFAENINTLVAMKNRWVELMQAAATDDGVPPDEQNQCWNECMKQAEEIIAAERAG